MKSLLWWLFWVLAVVLLLGAVLLLGYSGLLAGDRPKDLGVHEGRLKAPSLTRNSVSSQANLYPDHPQLKYAAMDAFEVEGEPADAILKLKDVLQDMSGVRVIQTRPDYLYAEAQSKWMGFVDDLEFWYNPESKRIEVRSASRLGREDFGVNRKRIEAIRARYAALP